MPSIPLAALVVGVSVLVLAGWLIFGARWKRHAQLTRSSTQLGLRMRSDDSPVRASGLLDVTVLKRDGARCLDVLQGEVRGAEALVFSYTWDRRRPPDPVAFFHLREKRLPSFELVPRISSRDPSGIQFDSYPRFGEIYTLTGGDDGALRELFGSEVLTFFERSENQNWAVASTGDWVAVTFWPLGERQRALEPKEILGFFEDAKSVLFLLAGAESLAYP